MRSVFGGFDTSAENAGAKAKARAKNALCSPQSSECAAELRELAIVLKRFRLGKTVPAMGAQDVPSQFRRRREPMEQDLQRELDPNSTAFAAHLRQHAGAFSDPTQALPISASEEE